uniref:Tudor domain-containing protein n=1 Tax=Knipowitschia caucasica TaxID=637954 RepID=A0AAV2MJX0_KNICA
MKLLPSNSEVSVRTSQKVQLIYKLFLLENARSALTKELDEFANKAYQEVQEFLNSSFPTSAFKCLLEALDEKCQAIEKLSQSLRNMSFTSQEIFYKHGKMSHDQPKQEKETYNITIPEFRNKRFEEIEIEVTHIVNPGNFYIQHADAEEKLQRLITDTRKESRSFSEQNCVPDIGTQVMGWFSQQKQWCRSQVTKICGINKDHVNSTEEMSITVEVKRLDYGDSFCLSLSNITEMTSEMAVLPLQAVQVSLAHVTPVNGQDWSEEAVDWFRDMVHKRTLYARVYPEEHKVSVELFLEKGNIQAMRRGASLSLRLTQNGHSKHDQLKKGVGFKKLKKTKDLEWEKYLISCYTQSNLQGAEL